MATARRGCWEGADGLALRWLLPPGRGKGKWLMARIDSVLKRLLAMFLLYLALPACIFFSA